VSTPQGISTVDENSKTKLALLNFRPMVGNPNTSAFAYAL